jgi:hypothetical protein
MFRRSFKISSPVFENLKHIPKKYSHKGENINPPLKISGVPRKTKSLVLIMEDPDAPLINPCHWILCHIDPKTSEIGEGELPEGTICGRNSLFQNKYFGPRPPFGAHRYIFKLFALDTELPVTKKTNRRQIVKMMKDHIIEQTELIGIFSRNSPDK